jgi:alkylhydroperoxidase family enzyme
VTDAVLADWRTAPVSGPLRAALGFLAKLTLSPDQVGPGDVEAVRAAGVSDAALADAIAVCALFNMIDRIADALAFHVPPRSDADEFAPTFYRHGYVRFLF